MSAASPAPASAATLARTARHVLVVEDDPALAAVLEMILTDDGLVVSIATCVDDAVGAVRREPFDLVITDAFMEWPSTPTADVEVASTAILAVSGETPVLLCSGHHITDEAARAAGFHGVLAKPFDLTVFEATVRHLLGHPPPEERFTSGVPGG